MVLRPPPPTGFSDIEPLGSMTLYIKLRTIIGKSTKLPSQHIAITKYCHHGILPLLTFAIPTFCHSNILQLQHYSISERKKKHFATTNIVLPRHFAIKDIALPDLFSSDKVPSRYLATFCGGYGHRDVGVSLVLPWFFSSPLLLKSEHLYCFNSC